MEELLANAVMEKRVYSTSCDKILIGVEPEYAGLAMKVSQAIGEWCFKEVSELEHCNNCKVYD